MPSLSISFCDPVFMSHRISHCTMCKCLMSKKKGSNVAKKIDAWIQKELRDSQYRGCTVVCKENNVYNIYMKPIGNKIDAMPLSGDSESGGCRPGPNL